MGDDPSGSSDTFEVRGWAKSGPFWCAWLLTISGALNTLGAFADGGWRLAVSAGVLCGAGVMHLMVRLTHYWRVDVDDEAATLVASWRRVRVPWRELVEVRPTAPGPVTTLRWERRAGRALKNPAVDDLDGLLTQVAQRAPHVQVGRPRPLKPFWS